MFVLESSDSDLWTFNYTLKSQLDTYGQFAIDGTYFQHSTGLYHIYSCWYRAYDGWPSNLCITKSKCLSSPYKHGEFEYRRTIFSLEKARKKEGEMEKKYGFYGADGNIVSNPYTVASNFSQRQILSVPSNSWEKTPYGRASNVRLSSNEGPEQLTNPVTGQTFIIYSAARSDNRNYCLGQLELVGSDPMNVQDWRKNNEGCVFYQNALEGANPTSGWAARTIRTQQFEWKQDGTPGFPRPGYGPYEKPNSSSWYIGRRPSRR